MDDIKIIHQFKNNNKEFIIATSIKNNCKYPNCRNNSNRIHSKYTRKIFTGSLDENSQEIKLIVRKFKYKDISYRKKISTERSSFLSPYSRIP